MLSAALKLGAQQFADAEKRRAKEEEQRRAREEEQRRAEEAERIRLEEEERQKREAEDAGDGVCYFSHIYLTGCF